MHKLCAAVCATHAADADAVDGDVLCVHDGLVGVICPGLLTPAKPQMLLAPGAG